MIRLSLHIDKINKNKIHSYNKELNHNFEMSPYLTILVNKKQRNALAKLRLSSHQLNIETGKHRDIAHAERKCNLCNTQDLEDEYHFSLICPVYNELRKVYIQKYFYVKPSMFKFIALLNSTTPKVLKKLANFILKASELRQTMLNANQGNGR